MIEVLSLRVVYLISMGVLNLYQLIDFIGQDHFLLLKDDTYELVYMTNDELIEEIKNKNVSNLGYYDNRSDVELNINNLDMSKFDIKKVEFGLMMYYSFDAFISDLNDGTLRAVSISLRQGNVITNDFIHIRLNSITSAFWYKGYGLYNWKSKRDVDCYNSVVVGVKDGIWSICSIATRHDDIGSYIREYGKKIDRRQFLKNCLLLGGTENT